MLLFIVHREIIQKNFIVDLSLVFVKAYETRYCILQQVCKLYLTHNNKTHKNLGMLLRAGLLLALLASKANLTVALVSGYCHNIVFIMSAYSCGGSRNLDPFRIHYWKCIKKF